jgi:Coenzyme PQQ synthesis protein D (PqqD)
MKDCYVARSRTVAARQLGEEMVIMSASDSTLFNLNPVATLIWQAADGRTLLTKIVEERICVAYEVEPGEALRDAQEFVAALASHGILLLGDSPLADSSAELVKRS